MVPASTTLHEPAEQLREETTNLHRAIVSLIEELEAVDWYQLLPATSPVTALDAKGYRGPYALALSTGLYNNLFRRYAGSDLLQIEHLKRLCTRGIVKAPIEHGVLVSRDVGAIILGQDLHISHLGPDAAHENFAVTESAVLKIDAPDAICTIAPG